MAKVTTQQLKDLGACEAARDDFKAAFGDEAEVNVVNAEKMATVYSGWEMVFGVQLLEGSYRVQYERFQAETYEESDGRNMHEGWDSQRCPACKAIRVKFVELYNAQEDTKNA